MKMSNANLHNCIQRADNVIMTVPFIAFRESVIEPIHEKKWGHYFS